MTAAGRPVPSTSDDLARFITLAETEHMTDAAAALRITQPTLSRTLARLEADIGAPLFDRRHGRLVLNASGEIYLDHARRAHAELEAPGRRSRTCAARHRARSDSRSCTPSASRWCRGWSRASGSGSRG